MAQSKETIKHIKLEPAENGFILSYDEYSKDPKNTYDGLSFDKTCTKVFTLKEKDKAIDAFIEVCKEGGYIGEESSEE